MNNDFNKLVEVVAELRGPNGCPWDKKQTLYSMTEDFLEEAYEFVDAINNDDVPNICEELGDLLLHVVIHSQIAKEEGLFTVDDVIDGIVRKLIRRHPHVFAGVDAADPSQALKRWEEAKAKEKQAAGIVESGALTKANKPSPSLIKAEKLQSAAAKLGFDWPSYEYVLNKADEELAELKEACGKGDAALIKEEIGDVLFNMANLGRHFGISAEEAMVAANQKFVRRFEYVEKKLAERGKTPEQSDLEEMDAIWNEVRKADKN